MRRTISASRGASSGWSVRSSSSETSAKSRAGRWAVPAKITSSMPPPRSDLADASPITQRMASSRLDLPQPLGPTMPVSPGSITSSAGSTKLLKPVSLSFRMRICRPCPLRPRSGAGGLQLRLQRRPVIGAVGLAAVDEEGRRRIDVELVLRVVELPGDRVGRLGIGEALARLGFRNAALADELDVA